MPKYIYVKLASVYSGKYEGLKKPCPPEELLDMWQRKHCLLYTSYKAERDAAVRDMKQNTKCYICKNFPKDNNISHCKHFYNCGPVSYTHLDVYKRQVLC